MTKRNNYTNNKKKYNLNMVDLRYFYNKQNLSFSI